MKLNLPIVLVGMMGCGKTSIGKIIAKSKDYQFFDLDHEIEQSLELNISEIFEKYGESFFRKEEYNTLKYILKNNKNNVLISVGGGAFCQGKTNKLIKKKALSVWIDVSDQIIFHRVKNKNKRPLLLGKNLSDLKNQIKSLRTQRYTWYNSADLKIKLFNLPLSDSARITRKKIENHIKKKKIIERNTIV